jgi:hypothetical protein
VSLKLKPVTLREANAYVAEHHRHHKPARGHKLSIGATRDGVLVGVAMLGRPVARAADTGYTAEVIRCCTDGGPNVCSFLYGAAARAAQAQGYTKIQTYILQSETGTSLKASGWFKEADVKGRDWNNGNKTGRRTDQPMDDKERWVRLL